ncbi:hypothetical protein PT974_02526 [Cladobotryum mycophilum]|uniref:Uncharacterized protein n=1 Tax=Cladobotryum mycophilum TaxID=491253 RepID=A0ABR0SYF7_9HYPO
MARPYGYTPYQHYARDFSSALPAFDPGKKRHRSSASPDPRQTKKRAIQFEELPGGSFREVIIIDDSPPPPDDKEADDNEHLLTTRDDTPPSSRKDTETSFIRRQLFKGIDLGFEKERAAVSIRRSTNVAPAQDIVNEIFRLDPDYESTTGALHLDECYGARSRMILPDREVYRPHWMTEMKRSRRRIQKHIDMRMDYIQYAASRYNTIAGLENQNPFRAVAHTEESTHWITCSFESLHALLEDACRTHGYRKLELDRLVFLRMHFHGAPCQKPLLLSEQDFQLPLPWYSRNEMLIDANTGSITIYETDIFDEKGVRTTWTWVKILKPVLEMHNNAPLPPVLAVPSIHQGLHTYGNDLMESMVWPDKCLSAIYPKPEDAFHFDLSDHTPDENKKRYTQPGTIGIAFRYSKNGVPTFACSERPDRLRAMGFDPEFLSVTDMPAFYEDDDDTWWEFFHQKATKNREMWEAVRKSMAENLCLMRGISKPGTGWVTVGPEADVVQAVETEQATKDGQITDTEKATATEQTEETRTALETEKTTKDDQNTENSQVASEKGDEATH